MRKHDHSQFLFCFALASGLLSSGAAAQVTVIDFDGTTAPCGFASTVPLTTQLIGMGVEFQGPGGPDGGAILDECSNFGVTGHSSPNFLAFNTGASAAGYVPRGPETILFTPSITSCQIHVGDGQAAGSATLECFSGMSSVGSDSRPLTPALQPLMVTGAGIDSCVISFTGSWLVVDDLAIDFGPPPPTCTLNLPASPAMDLIAIGVDAMSPTSPTVDVTLEFSTDSGVTFLPATMAGSSPNPNPATGVATGLSLFEWDSRADMVGIVSVALGVTLRATVIDAGGPGQCTDLIDVDNTMLCTGICGDCDENGLGPNILDALAAAQIAAGLLVPTLTQSACCDTNISGAVDVLDALGIAQDAAGLMVTLTCL